MIIVRGADEAVVGDVHELPQVENAVLAGDYPVHKLLRRDTRRLCLLLDLLTVLVRTGEEHHVIAAQALVAGDGVRGDGAVGMPDVQLVRWIVYRGGDIKGLLFHCSLPFSKAVPRVVPHYAALPKIFLFSLVRFSRGLPRRWLPPPPRPARRVPLSARSPRGCGKRRISRRSGLSAFRSRRTRAGASARRSPP